MACILLIQQDPLLMFLFAVLLDSETVEPVKCYGLEQAMEVCATRDDIVGGILDLQMLKDGCWEFHERSQWSRVYSMPILGVSHYHDWEAEHICTEFQIDEYVSLPAKPQRFRQLIEQCFLPTRYRSSVT